MGANQNSQSCAIYGADDDVQEEESGDDFTQEA
jgi:hypothetical protein